MITKALAALGFGTFLFIILQVGLGTSAGQFISRAIGDVPYGDKGIHFVLLTILTVLSNNALRGRRLNLLGNELLLGSLLTALVITLEECSQAFIPARNFELMDMVCNYAGIYAGGFFPCLQKQHRTTEYGSKNDRETLSLQAIFNRTRPLHDESRHGRRAPGRMGRHERG